MLTLKQAMEAAIEEIHQVTAGDPQEVLPKEFQLTAAMYRAYRDRGYRVHLEAGYTRCEVFGPECDLRIGARAIEPERWIEVKSLWNASRFVQKVPEHISKVQADVAKLQKWAPLDAMKFAVAFLFTGEQSVLRYNLQNSLRNEVKEATVCFEIPPQEIRWRDSKITEISAIAWQLPNTLDN